MSTLLALSVELLHAASPTPSASATPTPSPRLRLDIDRHVDRLVNPGVPRFEVEVERRTPQEAFEEHLKNFNTTCGPAIGGAPTVADMAPFRPHGPPGGFSVDITRLIRDLKNSGPERYFLYRVTKPEGVSYLIHEGRLPWSQLMQPGATLEPIAGFADRGTATRAWRRMERGYRTPLYDAPPPCTGAPAPSLIDVPYRPRDERRNSR